MKEEGMGKACSMHRRKQECRLTFGRKARRKMTTRTTEVYSRIILKRILELQDGLTNGKDQ
jgi:hypothetical protein